MAKKNIVMEEIDGEQVQLAMEVVSSTMLAVKTVRSRRRVKAAGLTRNEFSRHYTFVHHKVAEYTSRKRESAADQPFPHLTEDDLVVLERRLEEHEANGDLHIIRLSVERRRLLSLLRMDHLTQGATNTASEAFRDAARELFGDLFRFATHCWIPAERRTSSSCTLLLPWRAGLLCGEAVGKLAQNVWHIGVARDERTLLPVCYYTQPFPGQFVQRDDMCLVCDPMLATGGTTAMAIQAAVDAGFEQSHIGLLSLIAAPEGVDMIMRRYPHLRGVVIASLDERLNDQGYIVPGLGDCGDRAYGDIKRAYTKHRWVDTGLMTKEQATIILQRMGRA